MFMFARPNGKSRPPSGSGPGHAHGGKRRSHREAIDASQSPALPVPGGPEKRPTMKKLELPPVPAVVPDKAAGVHRWVGGIVQTGESGGCNDRVAALEELVKRLERKVDGQQERIRADLGALQQAVGEAVGRVVSRGQEDGAVIAAQRETVDRWKQEAGGVVEELRQLRAGLAAVSDVRGLAEAQLEGTEKRPTMKKKLELPPVPAVVPDSHEAEKVYPSEETIFTATLGYLCNNLGLSLQQS